MKPPRRKLPSTPKATNSDSISINKYIADTGFCSRREADKLIEQARVEINGSVALPGNRVAADDEVTIDGDRIGKKSATIYIALNKPVGIVSTTDRKEKANIIDFIRHKERIFPIGRLDKDSEGLILLTNDGNVVNKILRAGNEHEKEYIVSVNRPVTPEFIQRMRNGVPVLDTVTKPCFVQQEGKFSFRIILVQGLNRQIRRMCTQLGYEVKTLKRVRIMHIKLGTLPAGKWRNLTKDEVEEMNRILMHNKADAPFSSSETHNASKRKGKL